MTIPPHLIEPLSVEIARVFDIADLERITLATTSSGLFAAFVGKGLTMEETAFQLLQELSRQDIETTVLAQMLARRPAAARLGKLIDEACPEARSLVKPGVKEDLTEEQPAGVAWKFSRIAAAFAGLLIISASVYFLWLAPKPQNCKVSVSVVVNKLNAEDGGDSIDYLEIQGPLGRRRVPVSPANESVLEIEGGEATSWRLNIFWKEHPEQSQAGPFKGCLRDAGGTTSDGRATVRVAPL